MSGPVDRLRREGGVRPCGSITPGFAVLALLALAFLVQAAIRFQSELNHDTAWFIYMNRGMLDGKSLYVDFIEVNPPMAIWLTLPAAMAERAAGLDAVTALYLMLFLWTALSLVMVWAILGGLEEDRGHLRHVLVLAAGLAMLLAPGREFAQREHFLIILFIPWLMLKFVRGEGGRNGLLLSCVAGLMAGIAVSIKPHNVLGPLAVETLLLLRLRTLRQLWSPENIAAVLACLGFLAVLAASVPDFFSDILRLGVTAYVPYLGSGPGPVVQQGVRTAGLLVLVVLMRRMLAGPALRAVNMAATASAGFFLAYAIQAKGWGYQVLPAHALAMLALLVAAITVALRAGADVRPRRAARLTAGLACVVIAAAILSAPHQIYDDGLSRRLREVITRQLPRAPGPVSVFVASTDVSAGFPLVTRNRMIWASRFPCQWLIPYVSHHWEGGPLPQDPIVTRALRDAVDDLESFRPQVVAITDGSQNYVKGNSFPYVRFLSHDSRFAALWSGYEFRERIGDLAVYVRRSVPHASGP